MLRFFSFLFSFFCIYIFKFLKYITIFKSYVNGVDTLSLVTYICWVVEVHVLVISFRNKVKYGLIVLSVDGKV